MTLLLLLPAAAVVSPVTGPPAGPATNDSAILYTKDPGPGPEVLVPPGTNVTDPTSPQPAMPKAVLNDSCVLVAYSPNGSVLWSSPAPSPPAVTPCKLTISPNGSLCIRDMGNSNASVWCNEAAMNRSTPAGPACAPYTLTALPSGGLVEKDCNNYTVWEVPPVGPGEAGWGCMPQLSVQVLNE